MTDPTPGDPAAWPQAQAADPAGDAGESSSAPDVDGSGTTAAQDAAGGVVPEPGSHPVLRYTLARLGILVAVIAVLWLLGLRQPLLLLAFGFLISGVIAMVALDRSREGAAYGITSAIRRANARIDASARAEDDAAGAPAATSKSATADEAPATRPSPPPAGEPLDEWDDPAPR